MTDFLLISLGKCFSIPVLIVVLILRLGKCTLSLRKRINILYNLLMTVF